MNPRTRLSPGINENTRVAIIGTSFIGMELAGSIMKKGPKSVDVIGMDPVPFEKILGAEVGKAIQKVNLIWFSTALPMNLLMRSVFVT